MWNKIVRLFKSEDQPNLHGSIKIYDDLVDKLENAQFYLSQIKDHKLTNDEKMFLIRAGFNLSSLRDELKISYRNKNSKEASSGRR